MVLYMMAQAGLKPEDASFIGTGSGNTVLAAVKRGEVDAISNADPMINILDREGAIKIVADTRTAEGTQAVYGGPYPAATLYTTAAFAEKNPNTAQALVTALVRGLKWVQSHSPEEIAKVMPEEYALGNKEIYIQSIKSNMPAYSPDGKFIPRRRRDRAEGAARRSIRTCRARRSTCRRPTRASSSTRRMRGISASSSRTRCSATQRCIADAGPHKHRRPWRSRVCSASLHAALRPG